MLEALHGHSRESNARCSDYVASYRQTLALGAQTDALREYTDGLGDQDLATKPVHHKLRLTERGANDKL